MKTINLKIAIIEYNDIKDIPFKNTPLINLTKEDLNIDLTGDFDLILLEGAYTQHSHLWEDEKDEFIEDIEKHTSSSNSYFGNISNLKKQ